MTGVFERFAAMVVQRYEAHLCNEGPEVQTRAVLGRLERFSRTTPLIPVTGKMVSLAGFGQAPVRFAGPEDEYLLLSEAAESLGMPLWDAHEWAIKESGWALLEQRELDEERGDGRLGYECVRDYVDLHLDLVMDNPEAKPDAGGRSWSSAGDWLVSTDRLMLLVLDSPWREEFFSNTRDLMRHAFKKSFGSVPGLEPELPKGEAIERARRGPALDVDGGAR